MTACGLVGHVTTFLGCIVLAPQLQKVPPVNYVHKTEGRDHGMLHVVSMTLYHLA